MLSRDSGFQLRMHLKLFVGRTLSGPTERAHSAPPDLPAGLQERPMDRAGGGEREKGGGMAEK